MVFRVPHGKPLYSMWKWPGQRPEPRPGCVSELVDFSYGCWFLSFSGSVLHGFQQWCFSRRNSKCQLWAWPGVRRGAADTWGKRTEPSPSCHGSALIIMPESIISWLLFKGNHGSDSVPATAVMSVPKLRKRDLPGGRQKWLLVIMHSLSQKGAAHLCLSWLYLSTMRTWSCGRCCFSCGKPVGNEAAAGNVRHGIG